MKKTIFFGLIILNFSIGSCQENATQSIVKIKNDNKMNISPIVYGIDYDISNYYEILINDERIDKNNQNGTSMGYLPINELLLAGEKPELKIRLFKSPNEKFIAKDLYKYFKLTVVSSDINFENATKIQDINLPHEIIDKEYVEYVFPLNIDSYYPAIGWSKSEKLIKEDADKLIKEVIGFYQKMFYVYNSGNYNDYYKIVEKSEKEVLLAYFNSPRIIKEQQDEKIKIEEAKNKMVPLEFNKYKIKFYGNGRLVVLEDENGDSPLRYSNGKLDRFLGFVLHRPKPGAPLEIIR